MHPAVESLKNIVKRSLYKTPSTTLIRNFKPADPPGLEAFGKYLEEKFYSQYIVENRSHDLQKDRNDQLSGRLTKFRNEVVPWLSSVRDLKGVSILEIGCGTGSSTVSLAEQGANVTALDVDEASLMVAKKRMELYGLSAEFVLGNGEKVDTLFINKHFDIILFPATLEHMTYQERVNCLRSAYRMMQKGDLLVTVETPNRLWFYDFHTAYLPFYFWLPEELAFDYSKYSKRNNFKEIYKDHNAEKMLHFIRRGRGVSFHDFEIAFEDMSTMPVISSMEGYSKNPAFRFLTDRLKSRGYFTYKKFIWKLSPHHHEGFFEPWLDLIFKKIK